MRPVTAYNIDFMGKRYIWFGISGAVVTISIIALALFRLNFGLDFTGGTLIELEYDAPAVPSEIRSQLTEAGYVGHVVQYFGSDNDVLIRIPPQKKLDETTNARLGDEVLAHLQQSYKGEVSMRRSEFVGPAVGEELAEQGGLGILLALAVVMLYVAFRFQLKFAVGAVVALFHDVTITLGFFALSGLDFDLTVLAAILALIGYSLNDTIVVEDRIRENFRKIRRGSPDQIINISINQTLVRTIMTSFTTLLVLLALFFLGGELIRGFSIGLIIGIVVGTYSSIYIAASLLLTMNITREDLALPVKEGAEDPDLLMR